MGISKQHFRFILAAILCCYYYRWYFFVVADNKSNIFRAIKLFIAKLMLSAVNVTHDYSLMTLYFYSITLLLLFSVFMLWFYTCKSVKKCRSCSSCWLTKLSDHSCAVTGNDPASCLRWCLFPICLAAHGNNAGRLKDANCRAVKAWVSRRGVGSNVNIQDGAFDLVIWTSGATHDAAAQMPEHKFRHSGAESSNNRRIIGHCVD